jgi:hypothetical protein
MNANEGLLTSPQAAKFLAISERKLWELAKSKKIKVTVIPPRSKRYDPDDLLDFIDRCKENGIPEETIDPTDPTDGCKGNGGSGETIDPTDSES